ncbi:2-polyprenyl-6-methoxyphenol hydroxylase [Gammaproteobacteria bacterium]|jgi:2-polyprenyl-6-methoxyphenol hydroxylase-like FAD-dependent oxidoreductase|nr:2-polyprenyl-6-methoxyphenol hydroxylase [Gammaproteobacteria bacterium]
MNDTQVIVVGAGPVGLTLSLALSDMGVRCILLERNEAPSGLPKMERCNARTMEIYRRLGIVDQIRAAGLPADCPMDVFVVTSLVEKPILRLPYGSVKDCQEDIAAHNDGTRTLEPYQLISQYTLEPLLKNIAENDPNVDVRFGCEFIRFEDNDDHVVAHFRHSDGSEDSCSADYLVGCDGARSPVRKQLGIEFSGPGEMLTMCQALFRCDDLFERIPIGKGRHYHVCDDQAGFVIVQDDTRHFTLHAVVDDEAEMPKLFEKIVAMPIEYETLYIGRWTQRLLVADRYGAGRVFIAGDSAHLVIPTGGLGMNTGVGDVIDLAWKLQGTLAGWGGEQLLASYEIERRQIGVRNVAASGRANAGRREWRAAWRPEIRDQTPEGEKVRANVAEIANREQRKTNEILGIEAGYRYVESPLISAEPGEGPDPNNPDYVPTTWPGFRLPHLWLADGSAIHDHLSKGYILLRFDNNREDMSALIDALKQLGAPLEIIAFDDAHAVEVYEGYELFLLRPDLHIVWRGNQPPPDPGRLCAIATGHQALESA